MGCRVAGGWWRVGWWLVGWLAGGGLAGWLVGWLAGWLVAGCWLLRIGFDSHDGDNFTTDDVYAAAGAPNGELARRCGRLKYLPRMIRDGAPVLLATVAAVAPRIGSPSQIERGRDRSESQTAPSPAARRTVAEPQATPTCPAPQRPTCSNDERSSNETGNDIVSSDRKT